MFSHEGPTEETMRNTKFSITFYGKGWPKEEALAESTDTHTDPPTKTLITKVSGTNPGYGATCVSLLLSATTILKENALMPGKYVEICISLNSNSSYWNLFFKGRRFTTRCCIR